jgi:hypothetical protein
MLRTVSLCVVLNLCCALPALAQHDPLESYFVGKQVVAKIDMPGTEKGIDLAFSKPRPMDWNEYSTRLATFGVAIHKGDVVRITKFNVKKDIIEFQLNGGGYGTFGQDTNTTVTVTPVPKSQHEKDLEKALATATDPNRKRDIQHDLDAERTRRERQDADNQSNAQVASELKAQQIAQKRLAGGSRINLRWQGSIPSDSHSPDSIIKLLAEYIDFDPAAVAEAPPPPRADYVPTQPIPPPATPASSGPASQLQRGMKLTEVMALLGTGRLLSESLSQDGLKTQVIEYSTSDSLIDVTSVEGVVVRYSINSK